MASFIGALSTLFMASELYQDLRGGVYHFVAPRWWKVVMLVVLLWLAMAEVQKVHNRLEEVIG